MKTKWYLITAAVLSLLLPQAARASGACTSARFHDWQNLGCNQNFGGAGGVPQASCPTCPGMPRWWVSEPYISLSLSDTPLSYTLSSGQEMAFRFYYMQRAGLPETADFPTYYQADRDGIYPSATNCGTEAVWNNNWITSIEFWDANWEAACHMNGIYKAIPNYGPFTQTNFEALVFRPEGGFNYFYYTNNSQPGLLHDPKSQMRLVPSTGGYPLTNQVAADANGIYWGTNTAGFNLIYPDGSRDVYGFIVYANANYPGDPGHANTLARAYLSQRIDPQGRISRLGYERFYVPYKYLFRLKYVVDPDGRTNQFLYVTNSFRVAEIDDPYGRKTTLSYTATGLLTNLTDAAGLSSSFLYSSSSFVTNQNYCPDSQDEMVPCGYSVKNAGSAGWMTSLTTPYGTTSFNYYEASDTNSADSVEQRALYVTEPEQAKQLYYYVHNAGSLLATNATSPANIPGQTNFDDGTVGSTHPTLNYRNTIHWGRRQCIALSSNVQASLSSNLGGALAGLTADDFRKGRVRNWLWQGDAASISESVASEREPSPDAAGQIEGGRTWYNYAGKPSPEIAGSNPQVSCIARLLPDGTSQYTAYNYYPTASNGLVSDNELSYSKPDGTLGVLTNWFHYAGNGIDLISVSNSAGQYLNYGYNGGHQIVAITNALGQATTLSWNENDTWNLTGIQWPSGQSVTLNVNHDGYHDTNNDFVPGPNYGWVNSLSFAPSGRAFTINSYSAGLPASVTDDRGVTVTNTWDGLNRLTGTGFPDGTTISNVYYRLDLAGVKDRLGNWTRYAYDGLQHLTAVTNANNAVTTYGYCGCGSLESIVDCYTNHTSLYYDNQGNLTAITYPDTSSLTYQYDLAGRMTNAIDGANRTLQLAYNNQGLVTNIASANGTLQSATYDALNRPIFVTDANGVTMTNQFDALNELVKRTWLSGSGTIAASEGFGYTAAGLAAYTNRDQKVTFYGRDGAGRLTSVTNANTELTQFGYDSLDNVTDLWDGNNHHTQWQYNQYGWLTNKVNGLGSNVFRYSYNANGWVTNRWTPEKGNTGYGYDNVGNLKSISYLPSSISYSYDALNRLTNMVDAVGTTAFSYTPSGQLQSEDGPWTNDTVTFAYAQGLRTALTLSQTTSNWSQSYGYDSGWRLQTLASPAGSFGYSYNFQPASSLVTGIQLPNGANIVNSYDTLARLTGTALNNYWGHTLDGYTYSPDALGLRTNIVRNLGLTSSAVTAGFDNIGQLTSWSAAEPGGTLRQNEQLGFGYDPAHNLHTRNNGSLAQTFTTDAANQLNSVTRTGTFTLSGATPAPAISVTVNGLTAQTNGDFTFARTNLSLVNGTNTFVIVAQNKYGVFSTNNLTLNLPTNVNLAFDNNGSLTNDGSRSFAYDSENQLTNITLAGSWKSDFVYDGLNRRRIARDFARQGSGWVLTNETYYIYDGRLLIQERGTNNISLVTYTRGLDLGGSLSRAGGIGGLLARTDTNSSTFYHADGVGNITALIDSQENIVARYLYNPFGKVIGQWGSLAPVNMMQFSSKPRYHGLDDFGLRWNDLDLDRLLNQDPIGENGGINLYAYVGNNPVNNIDPLGLSFWGDVGEAELSVYSSIGNFFTGSQNNSPAQDPNSIGALSQNAGYGFHPLYDADGNALGNPASAVGGAVVGGVVDVTSLFTGGGEAKAAKCEIKTTEAGLRHVLERHIVNGIPEFAGKSKFTTGTDLMKLIEQGSKMLGIRQPNGYFARTFDAGSNIGINRATGRPTSILTIITKANGDLVTMFPGKP